jgi:predicted RNase H-like HicB family nuclease
VGRTYAEAKASLQELLAYALELENRKLTQALNLVTRS